MSWCIHFSSPQHLLFLTHTQHTRACTHAHLHTPTAPLFLASLAVGTPNFPTSNDTSLKYHLAGAAGNSFASSFFRDPITGNAFYAHNDENGHSGIHIWRIEGTELTELVDVQVDWGHLA